MHGCCMGPGLVLKLACLCVGASSAGDVKCRSQELNCDWCRDATNCGGCIGMCAGGACLGSLAAALLRSRHGRLRTRHRTSGSRLPSWLRAPSANTVHPLPPKLPQAAASRSMGCASTCPAARLASPAASERMLQVKSTACTLPQRHTRAVGSMCCKAHTPSSCRMLCTYEQCWAPTSLLTPQPPPTHTLQHLQQQRQRLRPLPGRLQGRRKRRVPQVWPHLELPVWYPVPLASRLPTRFGGVFSTNEVPARLNLQPVLAYKPTSDRPCYDHSESGCPSDAICQQFLRSENAPGPPPAALLSFCARELAIACPRPPNACLSNAPLHSKIP